MFNRETGKPIAIKDEGVTVIDSAASLDFTGVGVSATAVGDDVTTNIPGSSAIGLDDLTDVTVSSPTSGQVLAYNGSAWVNSSETGLGTVTSVSVVSSQGVSGTVATSTTTPAITLALGALTGLTSVNGLIITADTGEITTGTWSGTAIADAKIASALTGKTYNGLTVTATAGTLTIPNNASAALITSGNFSLTLTATNTTNVTLPTTGTLATTTQLATYLPLAGGTMTGALVLDDTSLQIQEGVDTLTITVPTLTTARAVTFGDYAGEVSLLGNAVTGSGSVVLAGTPTLTTPEIGVATGTSLTVATGGAIRTGTTAGNTLLLQAYDTDTGPAYTTFATLTAGTTPTMDLATGVTIGSAYIYRASGTDVALADGGTNASLTASTGGIVYSGASALAILAGTATAGQLLLSGSSAAPTWSTTTYPSTNAISTLLYASSANVMAALATANSAILNTSATGVPSITATPIIGTSLQVGITGTSLGSLKIAGNTSGLITLTAAAAAGTYTLTLPTTDGDASQVLTTDGAGILSWSTPSAGGSVTEVMAEISAQVNTSSTGDVYTDTAGDTYAETTNQTRMTLTASRLRDVVCYVSYHVNAGTGTIQLWNFTDSASLATATTTNVTETGKSLSSQFVSTNMGDALTLRVKNSGAGNTVTIDQGGMTEGDKQISSSTTRQYGMLNHDSASVGNSFDWRFYPTTVSVALLKFVSTDTFSGGQFSQGGKLFGTKSEIVSNFGTTFNQTAAGTVITRTPTIKSGVIALVFSAVTNALPMVSFNLKADNI